MRASTTRSPAVDAEGVTAGRGMASPRRRPRHAAPAARPWPKRGRPSPEPRQRRGASIAARSAAPRGAGQGRPRSGGAMGAAYRGQGGRAMGGSGRREELGRARGKDGGRGGKRLQAIRRYDLLWTQGGVSNVLPYRPPLFPDRTFNASAANDARKKRP